MSDQVKVVHIVSKEPTWLSVRCPVPTYEERVRPLAHHRLSELGTLGPRRRPCNCTTHTKLHSMSSWRTTLCTWSAVVEFREAPCAPGAARRASRVMDVLLLLLLLTTLALGQCTVGKDIPSYYIHFGQLKQRHPHIEMSTQTQPLTPHLKPLSLLILNAFKDSLMIMSV